MPELLEVEYYRRAAARVVGRRIARVDAPDEWWNRGVAGDAVAQALRGRAVIAADRVGKVLYLRTDGPTLGVRFGMTGRIIVDGDAAIEHLEYASRRNDPAWDRLVVRFTGGGELRVRDPRRLGGLAIDPDEGDLGPDAHGIGPAALRDALTGSEVALKARLLDQRRVAGIGNLLADEILWRASLAPVRAAATLDRSEHRRLHRHLRATIEDLLERGGSHTGDLHEQRHRDGVCPRDGAALRRETVGGRTTYWCPDHQR